MIMVCLCACAVGAREVHLRRVEKACARIIIVNSEIHYNNKSIIFELPFIYANMWVGGLYLGAAVVVVVVVLLFIVYDIDNRNPI